MELPKKNAAKSTVLKYALELYDGNRKKADGFVRGWMAVNSK